MLRMSGCTIHDSPPLIAPCWSVIKANERWRIHTLCTLTPSHLSGRTLLHPHCRKVSVHSQSVYYKKYIYISFIIATTVNKGSERLFPYRVSLRRARLFGLHSPILIKSIISPSLRLVQENANISTGRRVFCLSFFFFFNFINLESRMA